MIRAFIEGGLAAVCFLYALQTRIAYPHWMLLSLEHPWLLIIALIGACSVWTWSPIATVYILLILLAFIAEVFIFTRKPLGNERDLTWEKQLGLGGAVQAVQADEWWSTGWFSADGNLMVPSEL